MVPNHDSDEIFGTLLHIIHELEYNNISDRNVVRAAL